MVRSSCCGGRTGSGLLTGSSGTGGGSGETGSGAADAEAAEADGVAVVTAFPA